MEIDIRKEDESIQIIRVANQDEEYNIADTIVRAANDLPSCCIEDSADTGTVLGVFSEEHALNLMKGLQKAIDLGWFE